MKKIITIIFIATTIIACKKNDTAKTVTTTYTDTMLVYNEKITQFNIPEAGSKYSCTINPDVAVGTFVATDITNVTNTPVNSASSFWVFLIGGNFKYHFHYHFELTLKNGEFYRTKEKYY